MSGLEVPPNVDLFPCKSYGWIPDEETDCDISTMLQKAVTQGANEWFDYVLENNAKHDETDDGKLQFLIKIVQLIRTDLQKAIEIYNKLFREYVHIVSGDLFVTNPPFQQRQLLLRQNVVRAVPRQDYNSS